MRLLSFLLGMLLCYLAAADNALPRHTQQLTVDGEPWLLGVPAGMQLEVLTDQLDAPRLITFMPNGDLLSGSRSGHIYRLAPPYTDPQVLVSLDDYPHSLAWRAGELLIARTGGLYRAPYSPGQEIIPRDSVELLLALPGGGGHNSRSVAIGSDGRVYVALGITGNCSDEYLDDSYAFDDRRGGVLVLDESGKQPVWRPFAAGLRNPVGFDWHPDTGVLYASNNGPDHLGYEQPPEYFARLSPGSFHGMPWFQFDGRRLQRDTCIRKPPPRPATAVSLPAATFPSRNAPMGVAFVPPAAWGGQYRGNAIVALKGSWGTKPAGRAFGDRATRRHPALLMVRFEDGEAKDVVDLVTGFQRANGERLARPVGVAFGPDGALYFTSDSHLEGLFRLHLRKPLN
ncbi:MAG: sugar dehydrogenase [Halobacteria archaeon]|nr:sugar dehydrogenase [Halobacteria archaeon]